jgi:hypothetical protein
MKDTTAEVIKEALWERTPASIGNTILPILPAEPIQPIADPYKKLILDI